jgi:cell division protein FtsW
MRAERIYSWLHLEETRRGKGLQAYEAMVALGSGGVFGKGLGDGRQKLGFVPEHHTDFIFSIIGEELGLIATLLVIAAYAAIVFCGIYIAMNSCDTFGFLLGVGITFLIGLQAFINIGVVTGALPNKGLPLPFISYGGSNLLMTLISVGLLLSVARQARESDAVIRHLSAEEEVGNPFARPVQPQA